MNGSLRARFTPLLDDAEKVSIEGTAPFNFASWCCPDRLETSARVELMGCEI
ncbi:MAG: hypothetical protein N2116_05295 [Armatimonadetes bacterium]|nr:hypothetical protein [Armatimonadota bacterium]